jgi:PAS domain S-box-containing protein
MVDPNTAFKKLPASGTPIKFQYVADVLGATGRIGKPFPYCLQRYTMITKHILIVEDEPKFAFALSKTLEFSEQGYSVSTVHSGEEALQKVNEACPDLVLMDIQLAGKLNGVQTAAKINAQFDIPVVYLTAYADDTLLQWAKVAEPYGYLVKPVQDKELYATIEMALYKHSLDKKLKESEERFRALAQASADLVTVTSADGTCRYASPSYERILGYSSDELVGKNFVEFIHPGDLQQVVDVLTVTLLRDPDATLTAEFRFLHKDGSYRWLEATSNNQLDNPAVAGVVSNAHDVTERKQMEEALRESEERFRTLAQNSLDLISVVKADGTCSYVSPSFERTLGYSWSELVGKSYHEFIHPDDLSRIADVFAEALQNSDITSVVEFRFLHKEGAWRWIESTGSNLLDDPIIAGILGSSRDITERKRMEEALRRAHDELETRVQERTVDLARVNKALQSEIAERKQAEEALRESEERYRSLFNGIPVGLYRFTPEGQILNANPALMQMMGIQDQDMPAKINTADSYVPPKEHKPLLDLMKHEGEVRDFEVQLRRQDGTHLWVDIDAQTVYADDGSVLYFEGSMEDVTVRKQAQESLQQRNRELALLNRIGHVLSSTLDLDQVLINCLEGTRHLLDVIACSAWLIDPETDELVCRQATGPQSEVVRGWRLPQSEGLVGWTARNRKSLIVPDAWADERHFDKVDRQTGLSLRSILSTPLWVKQRVIGVLQVVDTEVNRFDETDLELLEPLAASAAIAIENARLYEQVRHRNEELLTLNAIATTISESPDLNRILNSTLKKVSEAMEMDGGGILLLGEDRRDPLELIAHHGLSQESIEEIKTYRPGDGVIDLALQSGQALVVTNVLDDLQSHTGVVKRESLRTFACVPLKSKDGVLGVLGVFSRTPRRPSAQKIQLLNNIGHQIGAAIENDQLAKEASEVEILQELDRLRSELIANVSHELRSPLGLIKVLCTSLLMDDVEIDQETQLRFLRGIDQETDTLEAIVNNLLNLSRVESGRLRLDKRPTDLGQLTKEVIEVVKMDIQSTQHRFVHDFPSRPLVATVDARSITQVLRNLLQNAVKYSPEGGVITVQGRGDDRQFLVWVNDQGIGIPPQDWERIFEHFYRVDNEITQNTRGAGLGLAVCQGIVEAHDGRIWVESTPGVGSTFYFTLPAGDDLES